MQLQLPQLRHRCDATHAQAETATAAPTATETATETATATAKATTAAAAAGERGVQQRRTCPAVAQLLSWTQLSRFAVA